MKKNTTLFMLLFYVQYLNAQTTIGILRSGNPTPYVPGLIIPFFDARHSAMGDAGVATSADYADIFWNPAKTAFAPTKLGFYGAYTPWLLNSRDLFKFGTNYRLSDNRSAISLNFTYFNQGYSQLTDPNGNYLGNFNSYDWIIGVNYARRLSNNLSIGAGLKYVKSALLSGLDTPFFSLGFSPTSTIAVDISVFHQEMDTTKIMNINYGVYISNLSGTISYGIRDLNYIPVNLKIGIAPTIKISKNSTFTLAIDANKLMIPTPLYDINGNLKKTETGIAGIADSFSDAPGGLNEELQEISWSIGGEYWYKHTFALRIGKFIESPNKGGRNLTTFGGGVKFNKKVNIDLAYLIDEVNSLSGNIYMPFGNMWRGNITFGFGKIKTQNEQK